LPGVEGMEGGCGSSWASSAPPPNKKAEDTEGEERVVTREVDQRLRAGAQVHAVPPAVGATCGGRYGPLQPVVL
jgi:hypothetical protein